MVSLRERSLTGAFRSIRPLLCALTAPGKALALHRPKLRPVIAWSHLRSLGLRVAGYKIQRQAGVTLSAICYYPA